MVAPSGLLEEPAVRWLEEVGPSTFLQRNTEHAANCGRIAQQLFAVAKREEPRLLGPLPELLMHGFDHEQMWQQLELRNKPLLRFVHDELTKQLAAAEHDEERKGRGDGAGEEEGQGERKSMERRK